MSSKINIDDVALGSVLLQRIAVDVDCIKKTCIALHHGFTLPANEVLRCLQSLERLWHRIDTEELPCHTMDKLLENIEVGGE